ncbi:MAG: DUF4097 domain-containing protein [Clostridiales bacterium]|nr:DUF4097 domain-containing protein [Clostridiales bacterium]
MVRKKVGTITLAIGLITAGSILFAKNFTNIPIEDIYRYWPLLLIGLGLEMIIYMSVYGKNNDNVKLSIDGLCIAFIIIAAVLGSGRFVSIRHFSIRGIGDIPVVGNLGYKGQIEERIDKSGISQNYDIKELRVINNLGDIEVKKNNSDGIRLEAKVRVRYHDQSKARKYAKNAIRVEEGQVTNIYIEDVPNADRKDYDKATVDIVLYVPKDITLDIKNSFGDIHIEYGGKTVVKNSYGDIEVKNCSKDTAIKNSFGNIHLKNIEGNIDASVSNGDISINEVAGNIEAKTSFGNIRLKDVQGDIEVESRNGNIEISEVKGSIDAETSFGNVSIDEESIENGRISAQTSFGSIKGFKGDVKDSGNKKTLEAKLGVGSKEIRLKTSNGNIEIK